MSEDPWFGLDPMLQAPAAPGEHQHKWLLCFKQGMDLRDHTGRHGDKSEGARGDVYDCGCGARRIVYPGPGGLPEIEDLDPDRQIKWLLCVNNNGVMQHLGLGHLAQGALGDPQRNQIELLTKGA